MQLYYSVYVSVLRESGDDDRQTGLHCQAQADLEEGAGCGLLSHEAKQACLLAGRILTVFLQVKDRDDSVLGLECLHPHNSFSYTFIS